MSQFEARCLAISTTNEIQELFQRIGHTDGFSPFQSSWFLSAFFAACCRETGDSLTIHTVEPAGGGAPLLALPIVHSRRLGVRRAEIAGRDYCDISAPILTDHFRQQTAARREAALLCLINSIRGCDLVRLRNIPQFANGEDNPLFALTASKTDQTCQLTMPLASTDPDRRPSRSAYKECDVKYRKLTEKGYRFREVLDTASRLRVIGELLRLREESFQQRGMPSPNTAQAETLYRHLILQDDPHNRLHVVVISNDAGDIVSGAALLGGGNNVNGSLIGISGPEWKRFSPGMVLILKIQDWAREKGFAYLNFGAGDQAYKEKFGALRVPAAHLELPRSLLGQGYVIAANLRSRIAGKDGAPSRGKGALIATRTTAMTAALQMDQAGYLIAL
ncbi:GNAT family N-acetyltransferase [Pannonibacter sp. SL95]|uniref:GNAT family N-acetyltransferase n=1 Tax=Pannonibacter sp. SL95 TaxID=2995153 RepID=UPI002276F93B|nr:GNAT family N-acetyltransferase [Pannonibacter sp. SL95]MCY1705556.1 GNAT family N-acetyltransferase [Pannonibacter sp. SL95]